MLAYDYPILGLFWTMLIFFLWFAWIMLVFRVIMDIFRSDMKGLSKALWSIFVIVIPWLGVLVYLIANGDDMAQRDISTARQNEVDVQDSIRSAAGGVSAADDRQAVRAPLQRRPQRRRVRPAEGKAAQLTRAPGGRAAATSAARPPARVSISDRRFAQTASATRAESSNSCSPRAGNDSISTPRR